MKLSILIIITLCAFLLAPITAQIATEATTQQTTEVPCTDTTYQTTEAPCCSGCSGCTETPCSGCTDHTCPWCNEPTETPTSSNTEQNPGDQGGVEFPILVEIPPIELRKKRSWASILGFK